MLLKIEIRPEDCCTVLALQGRIILGEESSRLRETAKSVISAGQPRLVLDVSEVTYVDSGGLGTLYTNIWVWTRNAGGEFVLVNPGKKLTDLLQITKLTKVSKVFPTTAEAVEYFRNNLRQRETQAGNV
jgi:anti-sigma B factor antagonist